MKIGDMTLKQVIEYCNSHSCYMCQFQTKKSNCIFHFRDLESIKQLNLDEEVNQGWVENYLNLVKSANIKT